VGLKLTLDNSLEKKDKNNDIQLKEIIRWHMDIITKILKEQIGEEQ